MIEPAAAARRTESRTIPARARSRREGTSAALAGLSLGALCGALFSDLGLASLVVPYEHAWLVVAAALLGALAWGTRLRPLVTSVSLLIGLLWLTVAFTPLCAWMSPAFERRDPAGPADAVYVFSSSVRRDGDLSTVAMSRLLHGLELVGKGWSSRLVISEFSPPRPSHAVAARGLVSRLGIDRDVMVIGTARNTHEEAVAVADLCRASGWKRVLVVTSPLHARRAAASLEHAGVEVLSSPSIDTDFDAGRLDRSQERLRAFGKIVREALALCEYRWRGWL